MQSSPVENPVRTGVLSTLAWFDVFGYPLTAVEVARYATLFGSAITVGEAVQTLNADSRARQQDGYYYIEGSVDNIAQRKQRFRLASRKLKRAQRVARLFGILPSVRQVAVCNSLAIANADEDSDIDFFVVCRPSTIWLTRLLLALPLIVLRLRPQPTNQKDKICLSFITTENFRDFTRLHLEDDDPYMRFWEATLLPVYSTSGFFTGSGRACLCPKNEAETSSAATKKTSLENWAKQLQMRRFPDSIKQMANLDSRVLISDDILKFHVNDRRAQYRQQFRARLNSLGL